MAVYKTITMLMVLFSTQIVNTYLKACHYHKKSRGWIRWPAWMMYILFQCWVMESSASDPLFILITNIILVFFIHKLTYDIDVKAALFCTVILYVLWMLVEIAVNCVLGKTGVFSLAYGFITGNIISKIIMYILVHVLKYYRQEGSLTELPFKYWLRLSLIPIATVYIIHNTFYLTSKTQRDAFFLLTTVLLLLVNYVTFDVYDKLRNQLDTEKRNLAYQQQIGLCNRQAAEREAAYQETRRVRHDLNDYLVDLKAAIQSGEIGKAEKKIDAILEHNQVYRDSVSRSGNLVVDSLINYKYSIARKEGIAMRCYVYIPEQVPFDGADLCIILGNLLDNAMEAVGQLLPEKRYIEVNVSQVKGSFCIMIQNPYEGRIRRNGKGQILTNKKDYLNHGLGLSSVQRSVDKYNGELVTEYENDLFRVTVLLYPPENLRVNS